MIELDKGPRCLGCSSGNFFLCKSFPGYAPNHARRHTEWMKQQQRTRSKERALEEEELRQAQVFRREGT